MELKSKIISYDLLDFIDDYKIEGKFFVNPLEDVFDFTGILYLLNYNGRYKKEFSFSTSINIKKQSMSKIIYDTEIDNLQNIEAIVNNFIREIIDFVKNDYMNV